MAIERKLRNFSKIMEDVDVVNIPVQFVKLVKITLTSGKQISLNSDDLVDIHHAEQLLTDMSFSQDIEDMKITLDFSKIEKGVADITSLIFATE